MKRRGWTIVVTGLAAYYVGSAALALTSETLAPLFIFAAIIGGAVTAFMASRDGHNALFGSAFLVLASFAVAAGIDSVRLTGLSYMENDFSFWVLGVINAIPLGLIGLAIGAVAVATRPREQAIG